jgi:predicted CXXCH cytochrome family protein
MRTTLAATLALLLVGAATASAAAGRLAPLPKAEAVVSHGPYEMGACDTCHERADPRNPGPASATNETCLGCHEEFNGSAPVKMDRGTHITRGTCTGCHSPHNSRKKKLLL